MEAERLLLSLSNLRAVDVPCELRGTPEALAALRTTLQHSLPRVLLTPRDDINGEHVVLSELLNRRAPAGWLAVCPDDATPSAAAPSDDAGGGEGGGGGGGALLQLAADCATLSTVLSLPGPLYDLLFVPRTAAEQDGIAFAVFATRADGVAFIARTIAARQVAVVLDLDATLLESEHLPVAPADWHGLHWQQLQLTQQPSGQGVTGRVSRLPDEPHHAECVHAASWVWKGAAHNYRVRQRLGWSQLRDVLVQENYPGGKLTTYVLSLGRPLYIQTAWQLLDPSGLIIPSHEFARKVNSARPEGVFWVPEKTPCMGVGLRSVFDQDFNMRLGPLWIADDMPEVYPPKYRDAVHEVPPYRPVAALPNEADDGAALAGMASRLLRFWQYCYGVDGQGGAVAAVSAAARQTLHQLCAVPLPGGQPPSEGWLAALFKEREALSSALLVTTFLERERAAAETASQPPEAAPVEPAVPPAVAAAVAGENDENLQDACRPKSGAHSTKASPEDRPPLRPSSQQDNRAHEPRLGGQPCKLAELSAVAAAAAAADEGRQQHLEAAPAPAAESDEGEEDGGDAAEGGGGAPPLATQSCDVEAALEALGAVVARACSGSQAEDGEVELLVGEAEEDGMAAGESADDTGLHGRKRSFTEITQGSLPLAPAVGATVVAAAGV